MHHELKVNGKLASHEVSLSEDTLLTVKAVNYNLELRGEQEPSLSNCHHFSQHPSAHLFCNVNMVESESALQGVKNQETLKKK